MNQSTRLGTTLKEGMKTPVVVATTLNIALQGLPLISGVQLVARDRILVKTQNNKSENGIYVVATGTWDRAKDFNDTNDVVNGQLVIDSNSGLLYRVDFTGAFDLGVTLISFFVVQSFNSKDRDNISDMLNDSSIALGNVVHVKEETFGSGSEVLIFDVITLITEDIPKGIYTGIANVNLSFERRKLGVILDVADTLKHHVSMFDAMAFYTTTPPLDGSKMGTLSFHVDAKYSTPNKPVGAASYTFDASVSKTLHNGGTIIDPLNAADLSVWDEAEQLIWVTAGSGDGCWILVPDNRDTQAGWFGVNGSKFTAVVNSIPLQQAIDFTPPSSTLRIETGVFSLTRNLYLGERKIHIRGEGSSDALKDAGNRDLRGTILSFSSTALLGLWFDHDVSPALENNSRFSTVKDLTIWGDGTSVGGINQHNATNVGIDISNKGILLDNVRIDYVNFGINVMRCVSTKWGRNHISADSEGLRFPAQLRPEQTFYDKGVLQTVAAQSGRDTFTTACDFGYMVIFGDVNNSSHFGCRQFSQHGFSGNILDLNIERGYNGIQFEGTNAAFGAGKGAATFGTESVVSLWIEAMNAAGFQIRELSDSAILPLIRYNRLHRSPTDASKVIAFSATTLVIGEDGINPLARQDNDVDTNVVGTFGDRVGGGIFSVNGVERNSVIAREMRRQVIPHVDFDRASIKVLGKQEISYLQAVVPKTAVKTATFSIGVSADFKAFILTIDFVGMSTTGLVGRIVSKTVFKYDDSASLTTEASIYSDISRFELTTSINTTTNIVTFFISQLDAQAGVFNGGGSISVTACGSNLNNFELDLLSLV